MEIVDPGPIPICVSKATVVICENQWLKKILIDIWIIGYWGCPLELK
jgi:hypothetical protein